MRDSLRRYKFYGRQGYSRVYGPLLAPCIHDHLAGRYDLITWMPLSDKRRRQRGYDQAEELARELADRFQKNPEQVYTRHMASLFSPE